MTRLFILLLAVSSLTGCGTARCFVNRLDNVCRHRCDCGVEASYSNCGHCNPSLVTPVVHEEDLPQLATAPKSEAGTPEPISPLPDSRVLELEQQLADAKQLIDGAEQREFELEEERVKLEERVAQLENDRRESAVRLQQTTDRLLATQTQLREVEVQFTQTRSDHEQIVRTMETRLSQLVHRCETAK